MNQSTIDTLVGKEWGLFIDGQVVPASTDELAPVYSPANGDLIAEVAVASPGDVNTAVQSAKQAFKSWSALPAQEREKIMRLASAYVRTQADRIAALMALEQGKPFAQSRSEVTSSCDLLDYYAAEAVRVEGYVNPTEKSNLYSWVTYQPVGVCGLITPWNYPVSLLSWKLGPALATGCTVVVKPTEVTPLSPWAFCQALTEGGIPAGVINVITGGAQVGAVLIEHPDVAKIAMTGSTETGKKIMQAVARQLKKVSLELGGHCPAIVCADADLNLAAEIIAYKGFRNMGQSCSSVNRVYAHQSIHDELLEKICAKARKFSIGDGVTEPNCDLGPMTTAATLEKVELHVADALTKGAILHEGGKKPGGEQYQKGHYYLPTVLSKVTPQMLLMQEETFGPVAAIIVFKTIEEGNGFVSHHFVSQLMYLHVRHQNLY